MEIDFGGKLKKIRKENKLSILDLSRKSGVSTGLISQIERGIVTPSVVSMWKISKALGTGIGYYFDDDRRDAEFVVRNEARKTILPGDNKGIYELLTPDMTKQIESVILTMKYGDETDELSTPFVGETWGLVVKGTLSVYVCGQDYNLSQGDSICFNSTLSHKYKNDNCDESISIWAQTRPLP